MAQKKAAKRLTKEELDALLAIPSKDRTPEQDEAIGQEWLAQDREFLSDPERLAANIEYLSKKWDEQEVAVYPKGTKVKVGPVKAKEFPWEDSLSAQLGDKQS